MKKFLHEKAMIGPLRHLEVKVSLGPGFLSILDLDLDANPP